MRTSDYRDRLRLKSDIVLVFEVLIAARQTATYSFVAGMVGLQARSGLFHSVIHELVREDASSGRPVRAAILVRKDGLPDRTFFHMLEEIGRPESNALQTEAEFHVSMLEALGLNSTQGLHALIPNRSEPMERADDV